MIGLMRQMEQAMRPVRVMLANLLWFGYSSARSRGWKRATREVAATQAAVLRRILSANAESAFGREHHLADVRSVEDYRRAAPIRTYEELESYTERAAQGELWVLTEQPVLRLGLTSGSTAAVKRIPYTQALLDEFQAGIDPWVHYLFRRHPGILFGTTYWSVTPVGERASHTTGGIPVGFEDEQQYFSPLTRWVLDSIMAGSPQLARVSDMETFRYATLRLLAQDRRLSWVSVWNPSFMTLLLDPLPGWLPRLSEDIRRGTLDIAAALDPPLREALVRRCCRDPRCAHELERLAAAWAGRAPTETDSTGRTLYEAIWPRLRLISCWAHGSASLAVPQLKTYFPRAAIQPKGLLATEAFVSFPFKDDLSALSLLSHFFEFEEVGDVADETAPAIRLAHELHAGRRYAVIVTTGGGLYRYRLNDLIEVADFYRQCPLVRFVGRQSKVVDVCGEKLNEDFVRGVVAEVLARHALRPAFWMLAPECPPDGRPFYTLFVELDARSTHDDRRLEALAAEVDAALQAGYHYGYSRRLGQLDRCRLFVISPQSNAGQTYLTVCTELGQRLGDIKPAALHPYRGWSQRFAGGFVGGQ
jgi:hypothetical protein